MNGLSSMKSMFSETTKNKKLGGDDVGEGEII